MNYFHLKLDRRNSILKLKNISIGKRKVKLIPFSSIMDIFCLFETKITSLQFFIQTRMTTSISCEAQEIMDWRFKEHLLKSRNEIS